MVVLIRSLPEWMTYLAMANLKTPISFGHCERGFKITAAPTIAGKSGYGPGVLRYD